MKKRMALGTGAMAIVAAGAVGAVAIAGGGDARSVERTVVATPIVAEKAGPVTRAGGSEIQTFYAQGEIVPEEGSGLVNGLKCPKDQGKAVGGGAATDAGIVVSYLSQAKPGSGDRNARTYYVGVDDNSGTNSASAGAFIEVYCAEGIAVKK